VTHSLFRPEHFLETSLPERGLFQKSVPERLSKNRFGAKHRRHAKPFARAQAQKGMSKRAKMMYTDIRAFVFSAHPSLQDIPLLSATHCTEGGEARP
jgi:hypothetical protein